MRLALVAAAALIVLLALGALLWLAPARSLDVAGAPAATELLVARPGAPLQPVEASRDQARVSAAPESPAAGQELAEVLVHVVADGDGAPMGDVRLYSEPWPAPPAGRQLSAPVRTDALGLARFRLPPGGVRIAPRTQLKRALVLELTPGETREATLHLRRDAEVALPVLVLDAATRKPLAGARVSIRGHGSSEPAIGASEAVLSDEGGAAVLHLSSGSPVSCEVSLEGYGPRILTLEAREASPGQAFEILLERGARLEGLVSGTDGAPLAGALVEVAVDESLLSSKDAGSFFPLDGFVTTERKTWRAITGQNGTYALDGLATGVKLDLEVSHGERIFVREPHELSLGPGEVRVRHFRMEPWAAIRGRVLDAEGEPIPGQALLLVKGTQGRELDVEEPHAGRCMSDAQGGFSFDAVQPGTWLVGPVYPPRTPHLALRTAQVVELPPSVPEIEIELRLQTGLFVSGHCIGPDGAPLAGASVSGIGPAGWAEAKSAADGSFRLGPLSPGKLRVSAEKKDLVADDLEVAAGAREVVLRLDAAMAVRGRVIDALTGAGLQGEVHALYNLPSGSKFMATWTQDDGEFELSGLAPGRYTLVARTAGGLVSEPYMLDESRAEPLLELRVAPGARARLRLPAGETANILIDGMAIQMLGEETSLPFRPGAFTVEIFGDPLRSKAGFASAGEVVEVDLR